MRFRPYTKGGGGRGKEYKKKSCFHNPLLPPSNLPKKRKEKKRKEKKIEIYFGLLLPSVLLWD